MNAILERFAIQEKLSDYLASRRLLAGTRFFTPQQWAEHGETYGAGAVLHLISDRNEFSDVICSFDAALTRFLERHGYYFEVGYVWSIHIYPLEAQP